MPKQVSYEELVTLTGKTYRTIKKRLSEASINPDREGKSQSFDSSEALPAIYSTGKQSEKLDLTIERAKLAQEQTRKHKRENDLEEGKVAPISTLTDAVQSGVSQMVPILEALPLDMKRLNPLLTSHDIMVVKKAIAKCRNAIADIKIKVAHDRSARN